MENMTDSFVLGNVEDPFAMSEAESSMAEDDPVVQEKGEEPLVQKNMTGSFVLRIGKDPFAEEEEEEEDDSVVQEKVEDPDAMEEEYDPVVQEKAEDPDAMEEEEYDPVVQEKVEDPDAMEEEATQPSTQLMIDPRRVGGYDSDLSEEDLGDVICIFHPASVSAIRVAAAIAEGAPQHTISRAEIPSRVRGIDPGQQIEMPDTMKLAEQGLVTRDLALRLSAKLKDPLAGFVFGRNEQRCDFLITIPTSDGTKRISNIHFRVWLTEGGIIMLEDRSTNGTWVEGKHLRHTKNKDGAHTKHTLTHGTLIKVQMVPGEDDDIQFVVRIPKRYGAAEEAFEQNQAEYWDRLRLFTEGKKIAGNIQMSRVQESPAAGPNIVVEAANNCLALAAPVKRTPKEWDGGRKYNKHGVIGKGAFATVYLLTDKYTGDTYAAKEISKLNFTKGNVLHDKIMQEMEIMGATHHENIVRYVETVEHYKYIYIVMDYIPEGTLTSLIDEIGPLKESDTRMLARQMLSALGYLHSLNITHRDIKPDNVLVKTRPPSIHVLLTDFGLSKRPNDTTFLKTFCGTVLYCAPEVYPEYLDYFSGQASNVLKLAKVDKKKQRYTHGIDIWSLAGLFFYSFTGKPPYPAKEGSTYREMLHTIMTRPLNIAPLQEMHVSRWGISALKSMFNNMPQFRATIPELEAHPWLSGVDPKTGEVIVFQDFVRPRQPGESFHLDTPMTDVSDIPDDVTSVIMSIASADLPVYGPEDFTVEKGGDLEHEIATKEFGKLHQCILFDPYFEWWVNDDTPQQYKVRSFTYSQYNGERPIKSFNEVDEVDAADEVDEVDAADQVSAFNVVVNSDEVEPFPEFDADEFEAFDEVGVVHDTTTSPNAAGRVDVPHSVTSDRSGSSGGYYRPFPRVSIYRPPSVVRCFRDLDMSDNNDVIRDRTVDRRGVSLLPARDNQIESKDFAVSRTSSLVAERSHRFSFESESAETPGGGGRAPSLLGAESMVGEMEISSPGTVGADESSDNLMPAASLSRQRSPDDEGEIENERPASMVSDEMDIKSPGTVGADDSSANIMPAANRQRSPDDEGEIENERPASMVSEMDINSPGTVGADESANIMPAASLRRQRSPDDEGEIENERPAAKRHHSIRVGLSHEDLVPVSVFFDPNDKSTHHLNYPQMTEREYRAAVRLAASQSEAFEHGGKLFSMLVTSHQHGTGSSRTRIDAKDIANAKALPQSLAAKPQVDIQERGASESGDQLPFGPKYGGWINGVPTPEIAKFFPEFANYYDNNGHPRQSMQPTQPICGSQPVQLGEEFKTSKRILAKLTSTEDSVVPNITITITELLTTWGRGFKNTIRLEQNNEDRVPKNALKIVVWAPGLKAGGEIADDPENDFTFYIATKATHGIKVNNVPVPSNQPGEPQKAVAKYWGKLHHGDIVTAWSHARNSKETVKFRFHCYYGESSKLRAPDDFFDIVEEGRIRDNLDNFCQLEESRLMKIKYEADRMEKEQRERDAAEEEGRQAQPGSAGPSSSTSRTDDPITRGQSFTE